MKDKKFVGHSYTKAIKLSCFLTLVFLLKSYDPTYIRYLFFGIILIRFFLFIQEKYKQFYQSIKNT